MMEVSTVYWRIFATSKSWALAQTELLFFEVLSVLNYSNIQNTKWKKIPNLVQNLQKVYCMIFTFFPYGSFHTTNLAMQHWCLSTLNTFNQYNSDWIGKVCCCRKQENWSSFKLSSQSECTILGLKVAGAAVRNRLLENFLLEKPIQAAIKMYFSAIQMQTKMPYASQKCFFQYSSNSIRFRDLNL